MPACDLFWPEVCCWSRAVYPQCWLQGLLAQVKLARAQLAQASGQCLVSRKPLVRRSATKAPEIRLLNPRFEEEYAAGKDFDPDRERAAGKHLRRQLQKEKRGAMRELRKDAVFLGEVWALGHILLRSSCCSSNSWACVPCTRMSAVAL